MFGQTISLYRFLLPGIVNRRLFILIFILILTGSLLHSFVVELAIINSQQIATALMADFLRYAYVLVTLLMVASTVAEDFQIKQFERLLSMPISRWQYIAAQLLVVGSVALILVLSVLAVLLLFASFEIALYWTVALWMEILLMGLVGLLAIISLEKIPQAVLFALAVYLLTKLSGLISQMLAYSVKFSDGEDINRFAEMIFNTILYIIPSLNTFAQNDLFFKDVGMTDALVQQCQAVAVYAALLLAVSLIDFYRKEFNL